MEKSSRKPHDKQRISKLFVQVKRSPGIALTFRKGPERSSAPCDYGAMPRYYFHLRNGRRVNDDEGEELPDLDAAHERAEDYAVELAAASVKERFTVDLDDRIEVTDNAGQVLLVKEFRDVLTVKGAPQDLLS